jgi:hypothetical protein
VEQGVALLEVVVVVLVDTVHLLALAEVVRLPSLHFLLPLELPIP